MAQTIGTAVVDVEDVSQAAHTVAVTIPAGVNRKVIVITAQEAAVTVDALTFNGTSIVANLRAGIVHSTATSLKLYAYDYDIPDVTAEGAYNVIATTSGSTTNFTLRAWPTANTATGAPEDFDTVEGTSSNDVLTGNLTSTDGAALFAVYLDAGSSVTSVAWTGDVTETDEQNEPNYTSSGAAAVTSGAGAKTTVGTPSTAAQDGNKVLVALSYAAGGATAAVTGTLATAPIYRSNIVAGGKTIIVTVAGDTFVDPFTDQIRTDLTDGVDAGNSTANGWNETVRDAASNLITWVRTSSTVATGTLAAVADYAPAASQTLTVTVPASALTLAAPLVATPTIGTLRGPLLSAYSGTTNASGVATITLTSDDALTTNGEILVITATSGSAVSRTSARPA